MTTTNLHRAAWAKNALAIFVDETWTDTTINRMTPEDFGSAITDLISDLLHLAILKRLDPEQVIDRAKSNFNAELAEELE